MTDAKQTAWREFCRKLEAIGVDPYAPYIPANDPRHEQVVAIVAEYQAATTHNLAFPLTWEEQEGRGHPLFVESKRPWQAPPSCGQRLHAQWEMLGKGCVGAACSAVNARRLCSRSRMRP